MADLFFVILFVVGFMFVKRELKLYKLRIEYVTLRVEKLKAEKENVHFFDGECLGDDNLLLHCQCERCEFGDSSSIGVVCCLDKPQFTDNGNCSDFILK